MAQTAPSARKTGTGRQRLHRAALLVVIALQVSVPAIAFLGEPPTRFGFQMFSALGRVDIDIRDEAGNAVDQIPDGLIAGRLRPDLPWATELPDFLCAHIDTASKVTVTDSSSSASATC